MVSIRHQPADFTTPIVAPPAVWRRLAGTLLILGLGLQSGACSVSFPIAGLKEDSTPTGSIARPAASLSSALDAEDWRRAKAALAVALDPQGNGADVVWSNPKTGAKGSFVALAPPFVDNDRVCRRFRAHVASGAEAERRVAGSACRTGEGEWTLRELKDQRTS